MKKTNLIIIFFMIVLVCGIMAETTMNPLTKGHADTLYCSSIFGCNVTSTIQADDFLLPNGSSCCTSGGGTTNHAALINLDFANAGHTGFQIQLQNSSNITIIGDQIFYNGTIGGEGGGGASPFTDVDNIYIWNNSGTITFNETKLNTTTNASIDLRVDVSFLQNLLDAIYASISYVDTRVDSIVNTTDSVIQGWINANSTADREYTDTRVNSIDNHTATIDSNASTACDDGEYLDGNGLCIAFNATVLDVASVYNDTASIFWENSTGKVKLKSPQDVDIEGNLNVTKNSTFDNNTLFVDSTNNRVGIGQKSGFDPRMGLSVTGDLDVTHTATENDDHAVEIDVNAEGFGDVKGIDIVYTTNTISVGEEEEVILVNIDESLATGGDVIAFGVLTTEGLASIYGLEAGALINPVVQLSGTFENMDSANNSGVDNLSNFISSTDDHLIFVNDDDYVTIGDATKFEELEFLLNTTSSNPGIKPTFEYSTGVETWGDFSPADGTNGMRNTGIIAWFDSDIPTWDVGTGNEYLIRITRTQNVLQTTPIEDKVQIAAVVIYKWDKNGDLVIREINATTLRGSINAGDIDGDLVSNCSDGYAMLGFQNNYSASWCFDVTEPSELDNESIIRSHNTTWFSSPFDNKTIIRTHNISWLTTSLQNESIIRSYNTTWITDNVDLSSYLTNGTDANFGKLNITQNATINGLHIDRLNSSHWRIWG